MRIVALVSICVLMSDAAAAEDAGPPKAARHPVVDTYQGESITDPYRWLEQMNSADVRAWAQGQTAFARRTLDAMPARSPIETRLRQVLRGGSPKYLHLQRRGERWFALEIDPVKNQPMLVTLSRLDGPIKPRILVDPNRLDPTGSTAIDFYQATVDGARVAVSLSRGGTESGDVHVYDVAS